MYFLPWLATTFLFGFVFGHRILLATRLFDFESDKCNPLDSCPKLNRYLFTELIFHTIFTIFVIILPFRSFLLFILNAPVVIHGWISFSQNKFYFSPLQLIRNNRKSQNVSIAYIILFSITSVILLFKLLVSAIATPAS